MSAFIPDDWVFLEGAECPNCMGMFLCAASAEDTSEIRCANCGSVMDEISDIMPTKLDLLMMLDDLYPLDVEQEALL